ncbi:hypothetical protein [Acidovorax radicis]|uniref:hypothetical protein n=1 Tax=Acidovorax radicis TaxID=758826 RepID=UPI001CF9313D|nr:hypothetical protein [Acidovorax radicis]UCV00714.1 hypothetical protein KI609_08170 [Acidovorax radicis]
MNFEFDLWGWYAGTSHDAAPRTTPVAPANLSTTNAEGELRANWSGVAWVDVPYTRPIPLIAPVQPEIVITAVQADMPGMVASEDFTDITVRVGSTLSFAAELRAGDVVLPIDDSFRMPIRSRDGRERVLLASMVQGVISFTVRFDDSRVWDVSEEVINADLPPEAQMRFHGVKVFAIEA